MLHVVIYLKRAIGPIKLNVSIYGDVDVFFCFSRQFSQVLFCC